MTTAADLFQQFSAVPDIRAVILGFKPQRYDFINFFPDIPSFTTEGVVPSFSNQKYVRRDTRKGQNSQIENVDTFTAGRAFKTERHKLLARLSREQIDQATGLDRSTSSFNRTQVASLFGLLQQEAITNAVEAIHLNREIECATISTDQTNYAANNQRLYTSADSWANPTAGTPIQDNLDAQDAIFLTTADRDNICLGVDIQTFNALWNHPEIVERISNSGSQYKEINPTGGGHNGRDKALSILADVLSYKKVFMLESRFIDPQTGVATFTPTINGTTDGIAIAAYVPTQAELKLVRPAYGYTVRRDGFPDFNDWIYDESTDNWRAGVFDEWDTVIGTEENELITAGFLFRSTAAV